MFHVTAQINNGDPCPKREHRAWDWEEKDCATLSEAIRFLLDVEASGFSIRDGDNEIASHTESHYGGGSGREKDWF